MASTTHAETGRAREEWRANWTTPFVSMIALIVAFSHIYTIGVFLQPLQADLGWSRTASTVGLTIVSVISVILAPFLGAMIDRYGSRRIALPGVALYCGAFASLSLANGKAWQWWALWTVVGVGSVCIKPTVWAAAITARFDRGRGLAMAVALCGSGLGGMFLPYLATHLIDAYGWRAAFATIGALDAALVLPLVFLLFDRGHSGVARKGGRLMRASLPGQDAAAALRSARFLKLAAANLIITVSLLSLIVHLVPILSGGGLDRSHAAATAGLVGLATIVGRLSTGVLLDRWSGPRIGMIVFALPASVCALLLLFPVSPGLGMLVAVLLGLSVGSEVDIVMYLASRYFGVRNFGLLYGTLGGLTSLGTGLGPLLASLVFDAAGSYRPLLFMLVPAFIVSAALVATLGRYPEFASTAD